MERNKKDIFFAVLMAVCFCVSAVILGENRIEKRQSDVQNEIETPPVWAAETEETEQRYEPEAAEEESGENVQLHSETTETAEQFSENAESVLQEVRPQVPMYQMEYRKPGSEGLEDAPPQKYIPLFVTVNYDYFDDALLIGDSRMEGIKEYGNLPNATFFADAGMSVFKLEDKMLTVPGMGKVSFDEVLTARDYGKVYLMLGLNELGYKFEAVEQKYGEILEKIRENQSDAVIYLCANLHVTGRQAAKDKVFNNENVDRVNRMIENLADGKTCIYIDANELFDDENGGLRDDYSSDAFHIYAKHYAEWVDWLCSKGI